MDRVKLLAARYRAATARPYFATALYALSIVPSSQVPTMGVDRHWRCYVSAAFVDATPVEELAAVWIHEVAHLLRDHHGRAGRLPPADQRDRVRVNVAQDCEINDDLLTDRLPLPAGRMEPHLFGLEPGRLFEEYVPKLPPHDHAARLRLRRARASLAVGGRRRRARGRAGRGRSRCAGTPPRRCGPTSAAGAPCRTAGVAGPSRCWNRSSTGGRC